MTPSDDSMETVVREETAPTPHSVRHVVTNPNVGTSALNPGRNPTRDGLPVTLGSPTLQTTAVSPAVGGVVAGLPARAGKPSPDIVLAARGITYAYADGTVALRSLNFEVPRGRKVVVLGANGSGKSTLFLHFGGVLRPRTGDILLNGEPVRYDRAGLTHLRQTIGLVFQDPDSQLFASSVRQDISFGPVNLGWSDAKVRAAVDAAIEATQIGDLRDRPAHLLSYGQKKRVAIAGVLAMDPGLIIADEPTAGLDPESTARLIELFDDLNAQGRTIVISTHDVELALAWADEVVVMRAGEVIRTGDPTMVFQDETTLRAARLHQPIVLETYGHLCHMGLVPRDAVPPRNAGELADLINCNCTRIGSLG